MRKAFVISLFVILLSVASFAKTGHRGRALEAHHTVKATGRPFKAIGHAVAAVSVFSFHVFDATVIDPFGVALQLFADGLDMGVAAPLEALPEPIEAIGDGVHVVYRGIDWAGQALAK